MTELTQQTGQRKLIPVGAIVKQTYALAWQYRKEYFQLARDWLLIAVAVLLAVNIASYIMAPIPHFSLEDYKHITPEQLAQIHANALNLVIFGAINHFAVLALSVSIAVGWHRLILLGEKVTTPHYLRFDDTVKNYLKLAVILASLSIIASIIQNIHFLGFVGPLLGSIVSIIALIAVVRISPMLPAVALNSNLTWREVWDRTSGNFWRICGGHILCYLPFVFFVLIFFAFNNSFLQPVFYTAYYLAFMIIILPIYLSYLSLSYQFFFENRDTPAS
jgi:hypothetical protein